MEAGLSPHDPNSYSRPDEAKVVNIDLYLYVNFEKHVLSGKAKLTLEKQDDVKHVILDSKDLKIVEVSDCATGEVLHHSLGDPISTFGSRLEIKLPNTKDKRCVISICYETSSNASALQWLSPEQTAGGKHPYLFSQCQAIHCRSMIPCQDTPSVKATYSAEITAPVELVVLMSAVREGETAVTNDGRAIHKFQQNVPVAAYLIAIAVGPLVSRRVGPRSHVWTEEEFIDKAAYEFAETEKMLATAEEICGPYVWGIYDLLVLPPSFPFGGMENPCLTFVTPTILAGDRSLADVVAHEISHSWTGNLVTNRNFEHFWLNEGFTMFVERKILAKLSSKESRDFSAIGGLKDLQDTIKTRGENDPLTCLIPNLKGIDPDDAFSTVPYEKGHTFLYYLEELVGGPDVFDPFLRAYLDHFKYKSIDTDDFKKFLYDYFPQNKALESVNWDCWLHKPGMPPVIPVYDTLLANVCIELAQKWVQWTGQDPNPFSSKDITSMTSLQVREFLALLLLEEPFSVTKLQNMNELYSFDSVVNSEIRFRWLRLCIKSRWTEQIPRALQFVTEQGRMKFVRPIYRDLYSWEEARSTAIANFKAHCKNMMYVASYTVAQDLHIEL